MENAWDHQSVGLKERLLAKGLLGSAEAALVPLTGGVSSDIYRVDDGGRQFVVKQALAKLKVAADWHADTSRNAYEQEFIRYVASFRPDAVPELLAADPADGFFCMEYLDGFRCWKADLLAGECRPELARVAGALLGEIHARSWGDAGLAGRFDTMEQFEQLRIDPYLRATASKHPDCAEPILREAEWLYTHRDCLVHGDYSPKNILHRDGRLVVLDCEVAWYGAPSFDLAFLLNHMLLKALYHAPVDCGLRPLFDAVLAGYAETHAGRAQQIEADAGRLLPMLMLARVDGKSPVEYLDEAKQNRLREFSRGYILKPLTTLRALADAWFREGWLGGIQVRNISAV